MSEGNHFKKEELTLETKRPKIEMPTCEYVSDYERAFLAHWFIFGLVGTLR